VNQVELADKLEVFKTTISIYIKSGKLFQKKILYSKNQIK
jgi:hypothetical protein